jgi:hypothetical protein
VSRVSFAADLPPDEFRDRLRRAFEAQEELIRKRFPAACRGAFEDDARFWIQVPDPRRSNQWNEAVLAAPRLACRVEAGGDGKSRVSVFAKRRRWSLGVIAVCSLAAAGLLAQLLWAGGVLGRQGPVPGMRLTIGYSAGAFACALLGMLGAWTWGRGETTPARMAILRAVGLFGAGRAR